VNRIPEVGGGGGMKLLGHWGSFKHDHTAYWGLTNGLPSHVPPRNEKGKSLGKGFSSQKNWKGLPCERGIVLPNAIGIQGQTKKVNQGNT